MGLDDLIGDTLGSIGPLGSSLIGGALFGPIGFIGGGLFGGGSGGSGGDGIFSGITGKILVGVIVISIGGVVIALVTGKRKSK